VTAIENRREIPQTNEKQGYPMIQQILFGDIYVKDLKLSS
jgi:hypothetical protein